MVMHNYMGAGLGESEKQKMIRASCDTILKDNDDFGGTWVDNRINH